MSLCLGRRHKCYTVLLTSNTLHCFKCCFPLIFQSCAFLFFAIISSLLGLMIVLLYGISVSTIGIFAIFFPVAKAVSYGMIVLGGIETIIGLMATVCSCLSCCGSTPPTPVGCCYYFCFRFRLYIPEKAVRDRTLAGVLRYVLGQDTLLP